jgi:ubiquitin-conjugating enzyme E2 Q
MPPPQYATSFATRILQKQFQSTVNIQKQEKLHELGWYVDPNLISGNLYQWIVELHSFDAELPLAKDMKAAGQKSVVLELRFPPSYPMDPPFVRVIRPRFLEFHAGGGGHVTLGGAICMELLTNSGWTAVTCMESLLLQVRLAITSTEPRPARLSRRHGLSQDYGVGEAVDSYMRACNMHGWKIPKDMELMRW